MKKTLLRGLAASGAGLLMAASFGQAVSAQDKPAPAPAQTLQTNLTQLNGSGASGTASIEVTGNNVKVTIRTTGASPNLAHAQHLHIGGTNACPTAAADADKDKLITTKEGQGSYGEVKVSLTTSGATDAKSALALDRYPKANAQGVVSYTRTFTLPSGVSAADLSKAVVVQHGISKLFNDKAKYDGDKKSSLDSKLPLETTIPAACGKLTSTPAGGPDTGFGSTAGIEASSSLVFGAAAVVSAAALYFYLRRPVVSSRN